MRLKDLLRSAALFTRTNLFGEAANDSGPFIKRDTLAYVATGVNDRVNRTVKLSHSWNRIGELVNNALQNLPKNTSPETVEGLTKLHNAIQNIAKRIDETNLFTPDIEIDQQDVDDLINYMPHMKTAANHYNQVIRDGTTFLGFELDEENDQIHFDNIENGVAQFARQHLYEVQMFAFHARSHLTEQTSSAIKNDWQALSL